MSIGNLGADFESHHIEGYALMAQGKDDGYFSTSLVSQIQGNLWTGGCIDGVKLPDEFEYVISLYPWEKYKLGGTTIRLEFELYDAESVPDEDLLAQIAETIEFCVSDGQTLVHCQAGLNRSGLLAALVLIRGGMLPEQAISLLREKRSPAVLCNPAFSAWLLDNH